MLQIDEDVPVVVAHVKIVLPQQRHVLGQISLFHVAPDNEQALKVIRLGQLSVPQHLNVRIQGCTDGSF